MFKKLLVVSLVACMTLIAGNAFAGWGSWGGRPQCGNSWECAPEFGVTLNVAGQDVVEDESFSFTFGYLNLHTSVTGPLRE